MDTLNAYRSLMAKHDLPDMRTGGYRPSCEPIATPEDAWTRLVAFKPRQGWLLFQSAQMAFLDGLPERRAEWGAVLAAEACTEIDGAAISIALEQDGRGSWTLTTYTHEGEGDCLTDELEQLAHNPGKNGPDRLKYRRYWRPDGQQGFVQVAACFMGFE